MKNYGVKTINGVTVSSVRIKQENGFYRWLIVDIMGRQFCDGGNFRTRPEAIASVKTIK